MIAAARHETRVIANDRGGGLVGNALRQFDETVCCDYPLASVSAQARNVGDAVAKLEIRHAFAQAYDFTCALIARRERKRGHGIGPAAEIGVNEIDADRMVADMHFSALGGRRFDIVDPHDLRFAGLEYADSLGHGVLDPSLCHH